MKGPLSSRRGRRAFSLSLSSTRAGGAAAHTQKPHPLASQTDRTPCPPLPVVRPPPPAHACLANVAVDGKRGAQLTRRKKTLSQCFPTHHTHSRPAGHPAVVPRRPVGRPGRPASWPCSHRAPGTRRRVRAVRFFVWFLCRRERCRQKRKLPSHPSPLPPRPSNLPSAERRDGGGFVSGFILGGVVFGALGFLFAPQVRYVFAFPPLRRGQRRASIFFPNLAPDPHQTLTLSPHPSSDLRRPAVRGQVAQAAPLHGGR
jgi:hypothetical protein